jgi:ubiquinone/menaquinone biosynthesis C-methylase UbiE
MGLFKPDFFDLANTSTLDGRGDTQWGWYDWIREPFKGLTVLDVGTGLSKIKERLPECAITTHEAALGCPADIHGDLGSVESKSFDAVTCFDVIEHVMDYGLLAFNMARIARRYVFVTTPGGECTENKSPYHFHEFHPWELAQLFESAGMKTMQAWANQWDGPALYEGDRALNLLSGTDPFTRQQLLSVKFLHPVAVLFSH